MMITVRLFGMTKMLAGNQGSLSFNMADGRHVKDLVGLIETRYPAIGELIQKKKVLVSVNQEIAHEETVVGDNDEVALLPPFAEQGRVITTFSMSVIQNGSVGFPFRPRDRSRGRDVDGITFEHYEGMAQKKLHEIRERALKDFDILELLIIHRHGNIAIGENIVLIIAGAEHRADAFRACKWAIDELKQITPIWKLEHTPEGEVWVEEHP